MNSHKVCFIALGSRTNLFYLRLINDLFQSNNDIKSSFSVVVKKIDFDKLNQWLPDQFDNLEPMISQQLSKIDGFEKLIFPNITLHETIDRLLDKHIVNYPVAHPVKATIAKLIDNDCTRIKLVGSQYGMTSNYLKSYFLASGIEVVVPKEEERIFIDDFRKKVYAFRETSSDVNQYLTMLKNYQQDEHVVLACTELSLMVPSMTDNLYDMSRVQIDSAFSIVQD